MTREVEIDVFHHHVRAYPNRAAFRRKSGNYWEVISWREYGRYVRELGQAMIALGHQPGQAVTILGFNRMEWVVADVAAMAIGGMPAGIYTTSTPQQVAYIVGHSESPICFVENEVQLDKLREVKDELPSLKWVVVWDRPEGDLEEWVLTFDQLLERGRDADADAYDQRVAALSPEGTGTLIYTSGTTGPPKAVMLSHRNLYFTARKLLETVGSTGPERAISFLPLSHIAEQVVTIHGPIHTGGEIWFAESLEKLPENLKDARPTLFFAVPRLWEKFKAAIEAKVDQAPLPRRKLFELALNVGKRFGAPYIERGAFRSTLEQTIFGLFDRVVYSKLKANIGLDQVQHCYTGAAPISLDVLQFFNALGIPLRELYGQSEDCGPTSLNVPGATRVGSVGRPMLGVEVKIADDGEILVRGENVFKGYFKDDEATASTLSGDWLHSGDIGEFDRDGFLRITDRKKDLIITAGGKNVAPQNIEKLIKQHRLVSQAVVIGDRKKYLAALLTLDVDGLRAFAAERGVPGEPEEACRSRVVVETLQGHIDTVNGTLARYETIKKFVVLPRDFSIETGELTPTMKVKRKVVDEKYQKEISSMYPGG